MDQNSVLYFIYVIVTFAEPISLDQCATTIMEMQVQSVNFCQLQRKKGVACGVIIIIIIIIKVICIAQDC